MLWFSGDEHEEVRYDEGMILYDDRGETRIAIVVAALAHELFMARYRGSIDVWSMVVAQQSLMILHRWCLAEARPSPLPPSLLLFSHFCFLFFFFFLLVGSKFDCRFGLFSWFNAGLNLIQFWIFGFDFFFFWDFLFGGVWV